MRRILIDQARRKHADKRGGLRQRVPYEEELEISLPDAELPIDLLDLDDALRDLEAAESEKAALVKLRYFAGLSLEDAAQALGISLATAKRRWVYARAWLYGKLEGGKRPGNKLPTDKLPEEGPQEE
jgi:RNA polymerase sigma factor (TIGR02999 family)